MSERQDTERHDPIIAISGGLIEVTCSCGRWGDTGFKGALLRGWDNHLAYYQVSSKNAGILNLDFLTDPMDGPVELREGARFPPTKAGLLAAAGAAMAPPTRHGPPPLVMEERPAPVRVKAPVPPPARVVAKPPVTAVARNSGAKKRRTSGKRKAYKKRLICTGTGPYGHNVPIERDHAGPPEGWFGANTFRYRQAGAAVTVFTKAGMEAAYEGLRLPTLARRNRFRDAVFVLACSIDFDLFRYPSWLVAYCEHSHGLSLNSTKNALDDMGKLLNDDPVLRWRLRRILALMEEQQLPLVLPPGWQRIMDEHPA